MVGWHHRLDGRGFVQTQGDSEGREAWHAAVRGVAKSQTRLGDWTTTAKEEKPISLNLTLVRKCL